MFLLFLIMVFPILAILAIPMIAKFYPTKPFNVNTVENAIEIISPFRSKRYGFAAYKFYIYIADTGPLFIRRGIARDLPIWKLVVFAVPKNTKTVLTTNIHIITGRYDFFKTTPEKQKDEFITLLQEFNAEFKINTSAPHIVVKNDSKLKFIGKERTKLFRSILK